MSPQCGAATVREPMELAWLRALHWGASAFGATLSESWERMPGAAGVKAQLQEWGIWDEGLTEEQA